MLNRATRSNISANTYAGDSVRKAATGGRRSGLVGDWYRAPHASSRIRRAQHLRLSLSPWLPPHPPQQLPPHQILRSSRSISCAANRLARCVRRPGKRGRNCGSRAVVISWPLASCLKVGIMVLEIYWQAVVICLSACRHYSIATSQELLSGLPEHLILYGTYRTCHPVARDVRRYAIKPIYHLD
jgi:hypothetical protein